MPEYTIRPLNPEDAQWVAQFIESRWRSSIVVGHGQVYYPHTLPGFVALQDDKPFGLLTYTIQHNDCEIVTIDSILPSHGVGTALIQAVKVVAEQNKCSRLWLITTIHECLGLGSRSIVVMPLAGIMGGGGHHAPLLFIHLSCCTITASSSPSPA